MAGGLGNDIYVIDNPGDIVVENADAGTDRVNSSISYVLGSNVENLILTGATAIDGTGNTLNNILIGNNGSNILDGGVGADTMKGGLGDDIFVFDTALDFSNIDRIIDFTAGQDKIELDKGIFSSLINEGLLSTLNFLASANGLAGDGSEYILYNTTSGALFYDADGNGQGVAVQFATITTKTAISSTDFIIAS
jgi:Ca2+-binding RTX toxin-like protein